MQYIYNDGGRKAAGYTGKTGDCVVRAIAIATGLPYQKVYDDINRLALNERTGVRKRGVSHAARGVYKRTIRRYMESLGWVWTPTMHIGSGCTVHLTDGELPMGRLVVNISKHLTAVIDGVIFDTHDPQRWEDVKVGNLEYSVANGTRCVYGYFHNEKMLKMP